MIFLPHPNFAPCCSSPALSKRSEVGTSRIDTETPQAAATVADVFQERVRLIEEEGSGNSYGLQLISRLATELASQENLLLGKLDNILRNLSDEYVRLVNENNALQEQIMTERKDSAVWAQKYADLQAKQVDVGICTGGPKQTSPEASVACHREGEQEIQQAEPAPESATIDDAKPAAPLGMNGCWTSATSNSVEEIQQVVTGKKTQSSQSKKVRDSKALGRTQTLMSTGSPDASPNSLIDETEMWITVFMRSKAVQTILTTCLFIALFCGPLWVLFDIADDPGNMILDIIMLIVMMCFFFECAVKFSFDTRYRFTFFFWMDVFGTVSMLFEISFLLAAVDVDTVVLRAARTAKLGARVGRLLKLVSCLSYFFGQQEIQNPGDTISAKVIAQRLMLTISTKVAVLTIIMVMVVPLFQMPLHPKADHSMQLWTQNIENGYRWYQETNVTSIFQTSVNDLVSFYSGFDYSPFKIDGYSKRLVVGGVGVSVQLLHGEEPARKENIVKHHGSKASIYFDFTSPHQIRALMDIILILFVMLVMISMSANVSYTLDRMLINPIERMLGILAGNADRIYKQMRAAHGFTEDDDEDDDKINANSELEMLEEVMRKLTVLAKSAISKNEVSHSELAAMDAGGRAVLMDMMNVKLVDSNAGSRRTTKNGKRTTTKVGLASAKSVIGNSMEFASGMSFDLHSWELNTVDLDMQDLISIVCHIFFNSALGFADRFTDLVTFNMFSEAIRALYKELPYHCYPHACDVLHTVFRLLTLTGSAEWCSDTEQYALLVAALCHDVGHFGRTNPFLVETRHELALRYNDKSPLENMHAATMFQVCNSQATDVFKKAAKEAHNEARKVCIAAILHTDNAHHFDMVKTISNIFTLAEETCNQQAAESALLERYVVDVLETNRLTWLELFLHLADVSNPLKPFPLCQLWAWRVLDEFFNQGDEEKRLSIPVGMLNDRDKINRPGSQHGFINFLVAPLVDNVVNTFPMLAELHKQMASNLAQWRDLWVENAAPSSEEVAKKDADVQKIQDKAAAYVERNSGGKLEC